MSVSGEQLTILVADDSSTDRMILSSIVKMQGHKVITASDGLEAVQQFQQERPQLILLDVMMPNMDGREAARQIKEIAGEEMVPIIFLTSLNETEDLVSCLNAGGDDFLTKPYNRIIIQAKIGAFQRMRGMQTTLQVQRDEIAANNLRMLQEQTVAKEVFDKITHSGCLTASNIQYMQSPFAIFNGDVLVAARSPTGEMYVLLGDFTGHGLPAAIGAMPLAEIFYGMCAKGFSMKDILLEINQKLKRVLPISGFCCGSMVALNTEQKSMDIWVGGVPDNFIYRKQDKRVDVVQSTSLPLGIVDSAQFDASIETYPFEDGDRLFMWSDGIHEAQNAQLEFYGEERLRQVFDGNRNAENLFNEIQSSVEEFIGEVTDDVTMIEIEMQPIDELVEDDMDMSEVTALTAGPKDWSIEFTFRPDTLREYQPLPLILHCLMEVPELRIHNGELYTLLAELYSNALEHGVLGLSSSLKDGPTGFVTYYAERNRRLAELTEGQVIFRLHHVMTANGGRLRVWVEDSGPGFDYQARPEKESGASTYCGRGRALLEKFCTSVTYSGSGNEVCVVYDWVKDKRSRV